jgi:molybdate transport system substrate-binding protein
MRLLLTLAAFLSGLYCTQGVAGELKVFSLGSAGPILHDLAPEFERATGSRLVVVTGPSGATRNRILTEQGDVGIINSPLLNDLEPKGRVVPGSATVIAKTSAGVAVRAGTTLDVSTTDRLKDAISRAGSIATVDPARGSALGKHMQVVADKLGVGDELRRKLKVYSIGVAVGEAVAKGEVDIGIGFIPEFMHTANIVVAGPLPGETDFSSLTTAVLLVGSKESTSGKALIEFLKSPIARKVIRARGMEPR